MMPKATRLRPTVKTEPARPSSGPAAPEASATCWSVRPAAAGKSAAVTAWAARTLARSPPSAGTWPAGSLAVSEPPQPASSAAAASSTRRSLPIDFSLNGRVVEAAPQVQARAGAVRPPRLGDPGHLRGLGRRLEPVRALDRVAHPEVTRGEHVGPVQREHEEHVRGPLADALDRGELAHHLLVGQLGEALELQ